MRDFKQPNPDLKKFQLGDGVNRITPKAKRPAAGMGWVVLNPTVPNYEQFCMETNTVSLLTSEHELIPKCVVTISAMNDIEFPTTTDGFGSLVAWITSPLSTTPIIVGVVRKDTQKNGQQKSNSFQFQRGDGNSGVLVEGYGDDGIINMIARNGDAAEINFKVFNEKLLGLIDMYVQGKMIVEAEDSVVIKTNYGFKVHLVGVNPQTEKQTTAVLEYVMNTGFTFTDEFGHSITTTAQAVNVTVNQSDTITLSGANNSVEQSLLGESTVSTLNDIYTNLITAVQQLQTLITINSDGTTGTPNPDAITTFTDLLTTLQEQQNNLNNLKSKNLKNS